MWVDSDFFPEWRVNTTDGFLMHHDGRSGITFSSISLGLIFANVKSGAILKLKGLIAFGLFSYRFKMSSEICGGNVTLKAGLDGLAASLMAY